MTATGSATRWHWEPLPKVGFGAIVHIDDQDVLDDPAAARTLQALWIDRGVLVVRGLPSDPDTHIRLARCFGEIEIHPYRAGAGEGRAEIVDVIYDDDDGDIYGFADGEQRGGWLPWHFDLCYSDRINHGGILRAVTLSDHGGETGFIDQIEAHAALPDHLKEAIEGLEIAYEMQFDAARMRFGRSPDIELVRMQKRTRPFGARLPELPRAIHPMVYRQPGTRRPVLHVSPWFAAGIVGHEDAAGNALLDEVIAHCTDPALAYYHRWERDDYVLWDNWRMMHCATGVPVGEQRRLQRIGISGDYGFGRMETKASSEEPAPVV